MREEPRSFRGLILNRGSAAGRDSKTAHTGVGTSVRLENATPGSMEQNPKWLPLSERGTETEFFPENSVSSATEKRSLIPIVYCSNKSLANVKQQLGFSVISANSESNAPLRSALR